MFHHDDIIKWKHFPRYSPFMRAVTGGFPLTKASDAGRWYVFFDVRLNPRLSKQSRSRCRWFVTPWRSLWRHCSVLPRITRHLQLIQCNDKHPSVLVENNHLVWFEYANFGIMITSHCQFRVLGNVHWVQFDKERFVTRRQWADTGRDSRWYEE